MLDTPPVHVPARPRTVVRAARLMIASALVALASLVVLLTRLDDVRALLRNATPPPSDASVDTAIRIMLFAYVAFLVLFPVLTRHVSQGRNWARVATCVLAGLGVVAALSRLVRDQPTAVRVLDVLSLVLDVAVVALLLARPSVHFFRPGSNPFDGTLADVASEDRPHPPVPGRERGA